MGSDRRITVRCSALATTTASSRSNEDEARASFTAAWRCASAGGGGGVAGVGGLRGTPAGGENDEEPPPPPPPPPPPSRRSIYICCCACAARAGRAPRRSPSPSTAAPAPPSPCPAATATSRGNTLQGLRRRLWRRLRRGLRLPLLAAAGRRARRRAGGGGGDLLRRVRLAPRARRRLRRRLRRLELRGHVRPLELPLLGDPVALRDLRHEALDLGVDVDVPRAVLRARRARRQRHLQAARELLHVPLRALLALHLPLLLRARSGRARQLLLELEGGGGVGGPAPLEGGEGAREAAVLLRRRLARPRLRQLRRPAEQLLVLGAPLCVAVPHGPAARVGVDDDGALDEGGRGVAAGDAHRHARVRVVPRAPLQHSRRLRPTAPLLVELLVEVVPVDQVGDELEPDPAQLPPPHEPLQPRHRRLPLRLGRGRRHRARVEGRGDRAAPSPVASVARSTPK